MVVYAPGIVADTLADILRQAAPILTELLQRPVLAGRTGGQQLVQIVYVGGKMFVVMKMEGFLIDLRLQVASSVGQGRQGEGIVGSHQHSSFPK